MLRNAFVFIMLLTFFDASAANLEREKRLAEEIEDSIMDGDALYLKADDFEFINIYSEAETENVKVRSLYCMDVVITQTGKMLLTH